jgi:sensor domain CHASE-containing protein
VSEPAWVLDDDRTRVVQAQVAAIESDPEQQDWLDEVRAQLEDGSGYRDALATTQEVLRHTRKS